MDKHLYVAFDGDNAGQQVGTAVLQDDVQGLHEVSSRIESASQAIHQWVQQHGGQIISLGGDEGTFVIDPEAVNHLEELRDLYQQASGMTVTLGHGETLSQAGKALMAGKLMGKDMAVGYDEHVEQVLADAHADVEGGGGDEEAQKLDEHYLSHLDDVDAGDQQGDENDQEFNESGEEEDADVEPCDCENCQGGGEEAAESGKEGAAEGWEESPVGDEVQAEAGPEGAEGGEEESLPPVDGAEDAEMAPEEESVEIPENEAMEDDEDPEKMVADASGDTEDEAATPAEDLEGDEAPEAQEQVAEGEEMAAEPAEEEVPAGEEMADPAAEMPEEMAADQMSQDPAAGVDEQPQEGGVSEMDLLSELLAESGSQEDVKARVAEVLQKFKANRDLILSMREKAPEMYESIMLMLKNMIDMARHMAPESPPEDQVAPEDAAPPAEAPAEAPVEEDSIPKQ